MEQAPTLGPSPRYIPHNDSLTGKGFSEAKKMLAMGMALIIGSLIAHILISFLLKYLPNSSPDDDHPMSSNTSSPESKPRQQDCHIQLAAFPVFILGSQTSPLPSSLAMSSCSNRPSSNENCAICLQDFADGDCMRLLPRCKHMFHKECIDPWLSCHSSHCPICRDRAIEPDVARQVVKTLQIRSA